MKKPILPIACGLYPYLYIGLFLLVNAQNFDVPSLPFPLLLGLVILGPVLGVAGIAAGLQTPPERSAVWGLAVKLIHIPFYLLVFFLFLILPLGAVFFFVFDAMTLISGCGFGIAAILRSRKEGRISTGWAVAQLLLHCCFVADIISAFLLRKKLHS